MTILTIRIDFMFSGRLHIVTLGAVMRSQGAGERV